MSRPGHRAGDLPLLGWADELRRAREARRRRRIRFSAVAVLVGLVGGAALVPPTPRLVWNVSASAPIGLYAVAPGAALARGDMVVSWLPLPARKLAAARRYIPINVPLVKRVAAVPGDEICANGGIMLIDGRPVALRRAVDGRGRPMPTWSGCHRLRQGEFLLLMDAPDSFDGRYFGITDAQEIVGRARLIWAR